MTRYREIVELRRQLFALKRQLKRIIRKIEKPEWHRRYMRRRGVL